MRACGDSFHHVFERWASHRARALWSCAGGGGKKFKTSAGDTVRPVELLKFDAVIAEVVVELLPNWCAAICSAQSDVQLLRRPGAGA